MKQFQEIAKRINVPLIKHVPGEHDAGLDGGALYREFLQMVHYIRHLPPKESLGEPAVYGGEPASKAKPR